jgi:hypothetical protein
MGWSITVGRRFVRLSPPIRHPSLGTPAMTSHESEHPDPAAEPTIPGIEPDDDGAAVDPRELGPPMPPGAIPQFATDIKVVERQVGEHVVAALQHPGTMAVLSTVMPGVATAQRLVSIPLDAAVFQQVQELILRVQQARLEQAEGDAGADGARESSVPCIGFKCVIDRREQEAEEAVAELEPPEAQGDQPG